jgi:phage terminase Nu1 subunit (DNA packaging protein)
MTGSNKGRIVNRTELAETFGCGLNTVDAWLRAGCPVIQRGARGVQAQFNTADVSKWRDEQTRKAATGASTADETELKRRKLQAETSKAELELAKARFDVAPIRDFERAQTKMCAEIRANVMNVPQRVVVQLLGETDETKFKQVLRAELALALEAAANADLVLADEADEDEE